jgi:hypothetical protein
MKLAPLFLTTKHAKYTNRKTRAIIYRGQLTIPFHCARVSHDVIKKIRAISTDSRPLWPPLF